MTTRSFPPKPRPVKGAQYWIDRRARTRWAKPWPKAVEIAVRAVVAAALVVGARAQAVAEHVRQPVAALDVGLDVRYVGSAADGDDGCATLRCYGPGWNVARDGAVTSVLVLMSTTNYTSPGLTAFVVPAGVSSIVFDLKGGGGGGAVDSSAPGSPVNAGAGGRVQFTHAVSAGETLNVYVGAGGGGGEYGSGIGTSNGGAGGTNGGYSVGGAGGTATKTNTSGAPIRGAGGGGGGATVVVKATGSVVWGVAAGGSGCGAGSNLLRTTGRYGGGDTPEAAIGVASGGWGQPGSNGTGGAAGTTGGGGQTAGAAGTATDGGAGGAYSSSTASHRVYGGGGGGAGWGGGGGGASKTNTTTGDDAWAGAGGDGFIVGTATGTAYGNGTGGAGGSTVGASTGVAGTNGSALLTYVLPPAQPGAFTLPTAIAYPVNVAMSTAWGTSGADPEGGTITYKLYYRLNGGAQVAIDLAVATNSKSWTPTLTGSYVLDVYSHSSASGLDSLVVRTSPTFTIVGAGARMIVG